MHRREFTIKILYITDLDGTLLNTDSRINSESLTIINHLIEQGMCFTFATARSLISARKVIKGLRTDIPVIVYNGAYIMNAKDGSIIYSCSFTEEERLHIKELLNGFDTSPIVYSFVNGKEKVLWNTASVNDGINRYISCREGDPRMNPCTGMNSVYQGDIFYYTCIGEQEDLQPIYDKLKDDKRYTCVLQQELYRPEYWLEIMPRKATKAEAMKHLKEILNCKRIISFGDALNDIPMFQEADEAYAVSNAVPELKQIATGIIGSNNENGVAIWLQEHYKKR